MKPEQLAQLQEDAEKWRDWTSGEYRLVCKEKYAQLVKAYKTTQKIRSTHTIAIPKKCSHCNGATFKIWGTHYPSKTRIEVSCMRCGKPQ